MPAADAGAADGLICAYRLDGSGAGTPLDWPEIEAGQAAGGFLWLHLDRTHPAAVGWLRERSGLDAIACDALLTEDTRPRATAHRDGLLLNLRGVNLNPGAQPEDMLSVRLWIVPGLVISTRRHPIMAIRDLRAAIEAGRGPVDEGGLVVMLANFLLDRMGPVLAGLDDQLDELETLLLDGESPAIRSRLRGLRYEAVQLRRYVGPQREALAGLALGTFGWLGEADRHRLREATDRVTRYVEDLDAARERAAVMSDELVAIVSERMNHTMYVLTIVAALFLPLGFLTGLLGINVGGMPGVDSDLAFAVVCAGMAIVLAVELWLLRRLRWI